VVRTWSIIDFVLVMLGGFLGTAVFAAVGLFVGGEEMFIILALAGQYAGHLFVLWLLNRSRPPGTLGFEVQGRDSAYLFAGLGLQLALSILFLPLVQILFPDGGPAQEIGSVLSGLESGAARLGSLLVSVVLAPITEELAFRGVLIVVSALVFSLFHLLGLASSNFGGAALIVLPQLFFVGVALAWVTVRSGRLGPAIFMHSGFNLLAAIVLLLPPELLEGG
jgi:membrane protease YdiL (CAAX protease family)